MIKKLLAFIAATLATYLTAVVCITQFNLAQIIQLGYGISLKVRLDTTLHDVISMLASYLPLVLIALLLAWSFTSFVLSRVVPLSHWLYALAGFTGLIAIHVILNAIFGLSAVAPTRTLFGLVCQGVAGGIGGWLFYQLGFNTTTATAKSTGT